MWARMRLFPERPHRNEASPSLSGVVSYGTSWRTWSSPRRHKTKENPVDNALLNKHQVAQALNVSTRTLDRLRRQKLIEVVKIRGRVLFRPEAVAAFVARSAVPLGKAVAPSATIGSDE